MAFIEFGMCWWASAKRLRGLGIRSDGAEHLKPRAPRAMACCYWRHFTHLEIGGRLLGLHTDLHIMYRPIPNPVIEEVMRRNRERLV